MAVTRWGLASDAQDLWPKTFLSMQRLAVVVEGLRGAADYDSPTFSAALLETLKAMVDDEVVPAWGAPARFREELLLILSQFSLAFPNWQDVYGWLGVFLVQESARAEARIDLLLNPTDA